ncbi:MAG TPA: hypothetical protein PKA58_15560, partial [Polyangium sp.]|nr:hypothetical protein [Polyangium sp.]
MAVIRVRPSSRSTTFLGNICANRRKWSRPVIRAVTPKCKVKRLLFAFRACFTAHFVVTEFLALRATRAKAQRDERADPTDFVVERNVIQLVPRRLRPWATSTGSSFSAFGADGFGDIDVDA